MDLKEQQNKLKNQIGELEKRRSETEEKLGKERAKLDAAKAARTELVSELADADPATEGWAEGQLDKIDREIVSRKRFIEGHEASLAKIASEVTPLRAKLAESNVRSATPNGKKHLASGSPTSRSNSRARERR